MSQKNLKQKAVSGMVWTALQRYSTMFIAFFSGIVLARLLTPYDYGCIGMLSIFVVLAESFIDGGFGSALIQKKEPTQEDYSTIFFWNLGMSVLLYIVLYFSAPTIARFYNLPLLCSVLRVLGIILFIYAFNIVQRNQLRKKLKFKLLSIVMMTTSIISLSVTITMAYHGYGVWSLVAHHILIAAIPALFFIFYVRWHPIWSFSWKSFREMFNFGIYVFFTHLLNQFGNHIQGLLIGKFYSPSTMGYYAKANRTENIASNCISAVMNQVAYPLYAEVQNDKVALGRMIRRLTMTLSYLTFPLLFILLLCAKPIFILLYSDKWLESVPYFRVLCIAGLAFSLQSINLMSISAIGKSKIMFKWTVIKQMVGVIAIFLGLFIYGIYGLLCGVILNQWFSYTVNIGLVSKHIGYKWWHQLNDIMPVAVVSIIAGFISYYVGVIFKLSLFGDGLLKVCIYVIIYLSWSFVFKPEAYNYTKSIVSSMVSNIGRQLKKKN